jgi:hypothetical protein
MLLDTSINTEHWLLLKCLPNVKQPSYQNMQNKACIKEFAPAFLQEGTLQVMVLLLHEMADARFPASKNHMQNTYTVSPCNGLLF